MFTDDWEPDGDYTRFFQPGTPARAHKFGASPYRLPPFIPTMSNYQLDVLPYRTCCEWVSPLCPHSPRSAMPSTVSSITGGG